MMNEITIPNTPILSEAAAVGASIEEVAETSGVDSRIHSRTLPFSCSSCEYKCNTKQQLTAHTAKHTGEKPYKCDFCSFASVWKGELKRHTMLHTGDLPYSCSSCDYRSNREQRLKDHVAVNHTGEKPFKCDVCSFATARKYELKLHSRIHTGDLYSCLSCDYRCITKEQLKYHTAFKHTSERPYKCDVCNYATVRKSYLARHTRIHTREQPYSCSRCDYKCIRKAHLKKHREIHTSELEIVEYCYVCGKCEKSFFESRTVEPESDIQPRTSGTSLCSECLKISSRRKSKIITFKVRNSFLVRN